MINYLENAKSLSFELKSTKERLENLIYKLERTNWGEVGKYKESILIKFLRDHLPKTIFVGSGFVVGHDGTVSSQVDIIIYDETPLLFRQGDFVVANAIGVLGIIEVKTSINGIKNLKETILKLQSNGKLLFQNRFVGLFVYEGFTFYNLNIKIFTSNWFSLQQKFIFETKIPPIIVLLIKLG